MKVNELYDTESRWLKAADLAGRKHKLTIQSIEVVDIKDQKGVSTRKAGLTFAGKQKGLLLNKTNAKLISSEHGDDMDKWVGKQITVFPTTTDFAGEQVDCIRVEKFVPEADPDDEIPF